MRNYIFLLFERGMANSVGQDLEGVLKGHSGGAAAVRLPGKSSLWASAL